MKLDILVIGAHPDDVEIGIGGTILAHKEKGYKIGVVDLTKGEFSSNGNIETRKKESERAGEILNLDSRINLGLPDGFIDTDRESTEKLVEVIRTYKPKIVLAPFFNDFHPDHRAAGMLAKNAMFYSGNRNILSDIEPFRPEKCYFYRLASEDFKISFIVDITPFHKKKIESIKAHQSQVNRDLGKYKTKVNDESFMERVISRDMFTGRLIGVKYGEALYSVKDLGVKDIMKLG